MDTEEHFACPRQRSRIFAVSSVDHAILEGLTKLYVLGEIKKKKKLKDRQPCLKVLVYLLIFKSVQNFKNQLWLF